MKDGILIIDKPEGISSAEAVFKIKKNMNLNKAGHTGTLDPFATGLLIICLNHATKIAGYLLDLDKTYLGTMILGIATDTQDLTGKVIKVNPIKPNQLKLEEIEGIFKKYQGEISQIPPMFSAKKCQGQKLYQLARKGIKIELTPRKVKIFQLNLLQAKFDRYPSITFQIKCSRGTYIRTIAHDIGNDLGWGAYLSHLRRTHIGKISVNQAIKLDDFLKLPFEKQSKYILDTQNLKEISKTM
jgi:tRNA pseudouridine55 synthase